MSDIVERLREAYRVTSYNSINGCAECGIAANDAMEAVDRIERLESDLSDALTDLNTARQDNASCTAHIHNQADRIAQLEAALRAIDEQFAEAAQDDCENGVRWLNKRAAEKYLYEYPHTSAAISCACKVARAALEERT